MTLILKYTAYSDKGLVRKNNEDSVYAGSRLLALADGMGGHVGGEIASSIVISSLAELDADEPETDVLTQLFTATAQANDLLAKKIAEDSLLSGMGTTLTALLFTGSHLAMTHVGDSRAYRLRGGELTLLTRDDTLIQILVETGQIDFIAAQTHPKRSLILKALTGEEVEPALSILNIAPGDRYLICSDGLTDVVPVEDIYEIMHEPNLDDAGQKLINKSLSYGAPDNVTVLLADVVEGIQSEDQPILAGAIVEDGLKTQFSVDTAPLSFFYRPHKLRFRTLFLLVGTLFVALTGSFYFFQKLKTNFYLGSDNQKIIIFQGMNWKLFDIQLSRPYLQICLEKDQQNKPKITFTPPRVPCKSLMVKNLSPTKVQSLHDLPKSNTLPQTKIQALALSENLSNFVAAASVNTYISSLYFSHGNINGP